jgi:hypothetical protein
VRRASVVTDTTKSVVLDRELEEDKSYDSSGSRIRCSLCGWSPRKDDKWFNAEARRSAGVKAGDLVTIALEQDAEKREVEIPIPLQRGLGTKLTQKLNSLSFTHKKEFIVWYSEAKKEETRARRVEKMKRMLSAGKVIS